MKPLTIAFIDCIGIPYDGSTIEKRGLGGSESAIIYMSRELVKLGFEVTVFNNIYDDACEGIYDGVNYLSLNRIAEHHCVFDIVIASRTVVPFIRAEHYSQFTNLNHNFERIKANAKHKVVWLHDTFCVGDHMLEELLVNDDINEIFTLSDFHTSYVLTCAHGKKRMFEVMKHKTFVTRNGVKRWIDEVDIKSKDPDLFVYNASVTKGMLPLVKGVWPAVKAMIPNAKLKVIGGYYRFRKEMPPDEQEKTWHELVATYDPKLDVEFTGVISQKEIAEICAKASFMLYPTSFPETFGISSLESLNYNTPIITCRFGAVEEIATSLSSYLMDYAIEPNSLYPEINVDDQIRKFINLTLAAHNNKYLLQQKQYYCNIFKDISGWDVVALQWKQHFFKKFNLYLSVDEFKRVSYLNQRLHKVFNRRFSNSEDFQSTYTKPEQKIVVISPFYNAGEYLADTINSVASQNYENYEHYLVNDLSTDNSLEVINHTLSELPESIRSKFKLINNTKNKGAVYNQINTIRNITHKDAVIMLLDGDDKLAPQNDIFNYYNDLYDGNVEFTYGSCWSMVDNIPLIAQPYPKEVQIAKTYRKHLFNWGIPYTHLRTFKRSLIDKMDNTPFQNAQGEWYRAGGDNAVFYALIEAADANKIKAVCDIHYYYNDKNPANDYKINNPVQDATANEIRNREPVLLAEVVNPVKDEIKLEKIEVTPLTKRIINKTKKKILVAIPTAKNIEPDTFKSIYDLDVPDDYEVDFQYFYGYRIDQIRNLIAHHTIMLNYDYLFSVDYDIKLPKYALTKLLRENKDIISGVYIQRKHEAKIPEIYRANERGGVTHVDNNDVQGNGVIDIDGCGFGCVLVKSHVLKEVGYPQFKYHDSLDFQFTLSEDIDFCLKAKNKGFKLYADCSVKCEHIGTHIFRV
jgi:glycosyltransferase involved in cell wall biosynthesis